MTTASEACLDFGRIIANLHDLAFLCVEPFTGDVIGRTVRFAGIETLLAELRLVGVGAEQTFRTIGVHIAVILAFIQLGFQRNNFGGIITDLHNFALVVGESSPGFVVRSAVRFTNIKAGRFEYSLVGISANESRCAIGIGIAIVLTLL